jgi:hypothetical protein
MTEELEISSSTPKHEDVGEVGKSEENANSNASIASQILKQVEFYFSDVSLPKDKYVFTRRGD